MSDQAVSADPCCGTAAAADTAGACCDPAAKREAVAAGATCCGNASAQTDGKAAGGAETTQQSEPGATYSGGEAAVGPAAGSGGVPAAGLGGETSGALPGQRADRLDGRQAAQADGWRDGLPVVVVGAGPVGLAAAAELRERGLACQVLEAGDGPAAAVRAWGHVRLFSPWRFNIDAAAARLLADAGWVRPDDDALPTGAQLAADYLQPLADLPAIKPHVRYGARVVAITRLGLDRVRTAGRETAPFLVRLADGEEILARAIIDASGTWGTPNVLGASGIPAHGEAEAAAFVESALPDVLGRDRERFAGRHTLVVGAGHSAANTLLALVELAEQAPGTSVSWAIRAPDPARSYGGQSADALPARGAIGSRLRAHVERGAITVLTGFGVRQVVAAPAREPGVRPVTNGPDGTVQVSDGVRTVVAHRIVSATGFRPDHSIAAELRLDLDPVLGSTRALAPLIDPNQHSCGTVPPHGVDELSHPEPDFFAIGVKSYGRAPTFLLATGYEQARSVAAALAGDWAAARDVQLDLPETGVCNGNTDDDPVPAGRGLATGVAGGLLSAPLNLVAATPAGDAPAAAVGGAGRAAAAAGGTLVVASGGDARGGGCCG